MAINILEKAEFAEKILNENLGFVMKKARLYSICENDDNDEVTMTLAQEGSDVYELLGSRDALQVAKVSDYILLATCGWASPIDKDSDEEIAPSEHPKRRRVRLIVMAGKEGMASCLRFSDEPEEVITDNGTASGSLAEALHDLITEAHS